MVTTQAPVPLHAPPQPPNTAPSSGVAVSVTTAPCGKAAEQEAPQLMPAGWLVMLPAPAPPLLTLSRNDGVSLTKCVLPALPARVVASPPYSALRSWLPSANAEVARVATPS